MASLRNQRIALDCTREPYFDHAVGERRSNFTSVEMIRHHYSEVYFVVPDFAMSAGTILCMSGDRIYMDYSSSLGPIDPQVFNGKDWATHGTNPAKLGQPVTVQEKEARAREIARALGDNKLWHSHGRMIGPGKLWLVLRLKIDDYSGDPELRRKVRGYNDLLVEYIARSGYSMFMHNHNYF